MISTHDAKFTSPRELPSSGQNPISNTNSILYRVAPFTSSPLPHHEPPHSDCKSSYSDYSNLKATKHLNGN
ncbi:hypothetical protein CANTEDRAFT_114058 [Yamadazyma tenuis ATCC 10573]|uniref:Uncharacterized protein n=1 Tax=Candida tenuis (strain ATCC 10573 / BCRC 21748 / CBS 615 / JCM 9827 / NBRC 10315 / NRRL Y-1498 / VKM Y-70) TaxID=590646 RepID=G3B4Z2_CANTC|nr:uncharacterized protein CANTEDRAFT_114058 [Yamadazyma tenuis ATCC 10573]EGV64023.1 hypothetical protein CANTEDRAFT_114058 [Yamadazyma tenuis ATCC 10573]